MKKTKVVHCKEEPYDVYIGRGSKWGNRHEIGKDGTREEVIEMFRSEFLMNPKLFKEVKKLKGKTLGCYCNPEACHGDVLVEFADKGD
jgi:hypothetical protein